ncbi:hypothetical protein AALO_G00060320 [Alosa alosa]|uniref:Uncharacterized protein n=1 Tax=Alosa alosa TaxID=278164 RepID=A0AAV6GZM4_9TELE|nr:hypothetical protein AALO_G00060320 [Alosa alosa]
MVTLARTSPSQKITGVREGSGVYYESRLTASCTNSAVIISKAVSCEDCYTENTECILEYSKCVPLPYTRSSNPAREFTHQVETDRHTHTHTHFFHVSVCCYDCSGLHQQTRPKSVCPATTTCYLTMSGSHGCCPQHAKLKPSQIKSQIKN